MKYIGLPLLIGLAALAFGLALGRVLRNALPRRQERQIFWKNFGPADYFIAALLTVSAIATGSILGYLLLVEYDEPVGISLWVIACWVFGEACYRILIRLFSDKKDEP